MQITDLKKEQQIFPLFRLGFRPLFLFGSGFGVVAMALWMLNLQQLIDFMPYGGSYWWHSHEMLFGFACAIIVGFLLTAVQNWTGMPGIRGPQLMLLFLLWLVARIGLFFEFFTGGYLLPLVDIAFMPVAAVILAKPLIAAKQNRNLFFVPVLFLFAIANGLMHASVLSWNMAYFHHGANIAIFLVTLVMTVVGGRVMPMFTANGTKTPKVAGIIWIEITAVGSVVLLMVIHLFGLQNRLPPELMALMLMLAGVVNLLRCVRWRIWVTFKVPLVWSLHLAYWSISLGLMLMAVSYLTDLVQWQTALHLLTVGGIGGLILAMISRVSLGHTGRMLQVKPLMSLAFASIFLAAFIRTFAVLLFAEQTPLLLLASGLLWVLAYGLFIWYYAPVLSKARVDDRPG